MQIHDFADLYRTRSNEELLLLVRDANQLTPEARTVLTAELATRRLSPAKQIAEDAGAKEVVGRNGAAGEANGPPWFDILEESHRIYRTKFWQFAGLAAPPVVVGFIAITVARSEVQAILRHGLSRSITTFTPIEILEMFLMNFVGLGVSWLAGCFLFAAICIAILQIKKGAVPSLRSCFGSIVAKTHLIMGAGLLLYVLCLIAVGLATLVFVGLVSSAWHSHFNVQFLTYAVLGLALLPLTRFGLAIPAIVYDGCTVIKSFFRSDELTEKNWLLLTVLLGESLVGGYVAGLLPFWVAGWLPLTPQISSQYPLLLTSASLACVTVVEPPIFIGFALLYLMKSGLAATPSDLAAI